jgi:hypothetical protein
MGRDCGHHRKEYREDMKAIYKSQVKVVSATLLGGKAKHSPVVSTFSHLAPSGALTR